MKEEGVLVKVGNGGLSYADRQYKEIWDRLDARLIELQESVARSQMVQN